MRILGKKTGTYVRSAVSGVLRGATVSVVHVAFRVSSAVLAAALLLTGCIVDDADSCGPGGGSDGDVTVGFRGGRLTVAGSPGADDGWGAFATGSRSAARWAGAGTRAGVPPTGMVDGAFQIGDLWVDGNRGKGVEKEMTWPEATQYCADLGLRLPTYDEMQQIIQYVRANSPLPDNRKFEFWNFTWEEPSYRYWTSTPRVDNPDYIWHGLIDYAHNRWNMDGWSADDGEELSARCVNRDEGGLPPGPDPGPDVDNPDGLPVGTTFRVVVYEAGADPQSASPVDQNTYKIADADGTIVAAAVDERGNATADAARELVLRRGAYDFYYFSPAVSANTALPNPGTYTGLANGADYMALAHRETIDPSKGSKHYIPEVCFYRMGSYIDVRIRPRAGEVVRTLEVTGDGLQLWGLPASGRYEIGDYPYRLITEGRGGMVEFAASDFAAEEGTTATASTLGVGGGRAVLPGYAGELQVKVTLTSDGKEMKLDASLAGHNFAPGYRYVVELGVGRIADNPELDIEILPWNEYDWGDGGIGGGGYLPIDTGGSTLLEPELEELGTWQQAVDYCRGKGDNWRLPTANELYYYWCVEPSVRVLDPFMEANYWSSTTNASNADQAWTFDFGYGIAYKKEKLTRNYVRCVRDKESGAGTKYPYVKAEGDATLVVLRDAAGGLDRNSLFASRPTATLIDTKRSGNNRMSAMLQVQRADPGLLNWRPSVDYCDNLREEGYDDWRLPSQRELMMIWTMGGNEHVESLDIDNSSDSPVQRPVGNARLHSLAGFTVLPDNVLLSATWDEDDPDNYPDITAILRISGTDGRVNTDAIDGDHPRSFRCVRDWNGSAPDYTVSENAVMPAGDIPGEGKTYSLTLTGNIPYSGVDVRAQSGNTALVSGTVTKSGTAVSLAVPANQSFDARTVTFEYNLNGTWTKIGDSRTQAGYSVTAATHNAPATIPGPGGSYNVTLTGYLPAAGVEVRAQSGGTALVTGKVTASGTAVSLAVPAHASYSSRTVTFEYNWNGTWTKIGTDCTQQGYNVSNATHTAPATIPGPGGSYNVTLTGYLPSSVSIRALSGSSVLVSGTVAKSGTAVSLSVPGNQSYNGRTVTFQYNWNGTWTKIGADRTQAGYSVTAATHTAPATIPGPGGSYNVTLTGHLPSGVSIRALSGSTVLVSGTVTRSGTAVSLSVPGNQSYNGRTVTFQYNWNGTWTKIGDDRSQQGWNVTKASVSSSGDIPRAGGTYTVTLEGWGGYQIRAMSGSTQLVINTNAPGDSKNYRASLTVPAWTSTDAARQVSFQYRFNGTWKTIETRTQNIYVAHINDLYMHVDLCTARCGGHDNYWRLSEVGLIAWKTIEGLPLDPVWDVPIGERYVFFNSAGRGDKYIIRHINDAPPTRSESGAVFNYKRNGKTFTSFTHYTTWWNDQDVGAGGSSWHAHCLCKGEIPALQ